jgi:hypothetical protein
MFQTVNVHMGCILSRRVLRSDVVLFHAKVSKEST